MAQPVLKVEALFETLAGLWQQRATIDGDYLPLIRVKKEAEKLLRLDPYSRGQAHLILAFVETILWNRQRAFFHLDQFQSLVKSKSEDDLLNLSLVFSFFGEFSKSADLSEEAVKADVADAFIEGAIDYCLYAGRWRKACGYFDRLIAKNFNGVDFKLLSSILDHEKIFDHEIEELYSLVSKVLQRANIPWLMHQMNIFDGQVLDTFFLDGRYCDSGVDLVWNLAEAVAKNAAVSKIWGTIVVDFMVWEPPGEEVTGGGAAG